MQTMLRISAHRLDIEIGRYAKLDTADRLCSKCSLDVLGDEIHFLIECPTLNATREALISLVHDKCRNFVGMNNFTKYFWLLNCEDERVMHELANFIHLNLDK